MSKFKKWLSNLLERIGNAKPKPEYDYETVSAYSKSVKNENNKTRV